MESTTYTHTKLSASEGCYLTQSADVDAAHRIIGREVYLAVTDSPDNWREISAEEADAYKAARAEALEAKRAGAHEATANAEK